MLETEIFTLDDVIQEKEKYLLALENCVTLAELDMLKIEALGKKSHFSTYLKALGKIKDSAQQKQYGQFINDAKQDITQKIQEKKYSLKKAELEKRLETERLDVTLSVRPEAGGSLHPVSKVSAEIIEILGKLGFSLAEGPEIESEDYNFTKLNIPEDHPARQMHDTFYFSEGEDGLRSLLRTHTSPVQIRTMLSENPPIRIIALGKTYRCDSDMTHTPMFHQVEGLVIEKNVTLAHLRGTLQYFCETFFETNKIELRFRPSFFPFTEPSMEVDVRCDRSGGKIKIGEGSDWLEILGAGMVHPNVLKNCGLDPLKVQGFCFWDGN